MIFQKEKDLYEKELHMNRPYVLCHMVTSVDGKVTGEFLRRPACAPATEVYYQLNRDYKEQGSGGFICGRITMEESFTGGWYPDLSAYEPTEREAGFLMNFWTDDTAKDTYFAIAFDPKGRLGWQSNVIRDEDPGYDGARIIEVVTKQVDPRYLTYLREREIPYIVAGEKEIDVPLALLALHEHLSPSFYVLEGGSIINGHFLRADCVDEISLVQAPITAGKDGKPLFAEGECRAFRLVEAKQQDGTLVTRYKKA